MAYLYNRFCKGVKNNNSGIQMTLWKTNFNMPVPDIWGNGSGWVEGVGVFTYYGESSSFDLSGFNYGWEVIIAVSGVHREGTEGGGLDHTISQTWRDEFGTVMFTNSTVINLQNQGVGDWEEYQLGSNQGVAPWEIDNDGVYSCVVEVSGPNINLSTQYNVTFTNVPTFTSYKTPGAMWVEGTDFCYVGYNAFVHRITGVDLGNVGVGSSGYIWINTSTSSPALLYIDEYGEKRVTPWNIKQFASIFSNGATGPVNGQTPGYIYTDQEFGHAHLSYIGNDGSKYLIGDGHYPYQNPY